jgi:hypothetical protein
MAIVRSEQVAPPSAQGSRHRDQIAADKRQWIKSAFGTLHSHRGMAD